MYEGREQKLAQFVEWASKHVSGDEKGEAQTFIDHLFIAFGQKGAHEVGGTRGSAFAIVNSCGKVTNRFLICP
ncbi:MAG: hypothetical protein ACTHLN_12650 [Tepidisphaeraceae bacterium]